MAAFLLPKKEKHRSRVNFKHFLQDQVQLYPFAPSEAAIVELIANALDAQCTRIDIILDKEKALFEFIDNGRGMTQQEFHDYHDFAMSLKKRGGGIGFAGLGAKLGLWVSKRVTTETRSPSYHGCSRWQFEEEELVWEEVRRRTLAQNGTKVVFELQSHRDPILLSEELHRIFQRHYYPLFDSYLYQIYMKAGIYPGKLSIFVNDVELPIGDPVASGAEKREEFWLTLGRRRKPVGIGYFLLAKGDLDEDARGIAISTYGKVVKREWFGETPRDMSRITGFVEVPHLAEILTTTKTDFIKFGTEGQKYYAFRREAQQKFKEWLVEIGKSEREPQRPKEAEHLERMLRNILNKVPELQTVFGSRTTAEVLLLREGGENSATTSPMAQAVHGTEAGAGGGGGVPISPGSSETPGVAASPAGAKRSSLTRRSIRFGPRVGWLADPGREAMGWIEGETIYINSAHPSYERALREGLKGYQDLLSVAVVLVEQAAPQTPHEALQLVNRFFTAWGQP